MNSGRAIAHVAAGATFHAIGLELCNELCPGLVVFGLRNELFIAKAC